MLGVVRSSLKMINVFMQNLWMLHDVVVVVRATVLLRGMRTSSCRNMSQQGGQTHAACCNMSRRHFAIVWSELANTGPTMLGYVGMKCCDRLAEA